MSLKYWCQAELKAFAIDLKPLAATTQQIDFFTATTIVVAELLSIHVVPELCDVEMLFHLTFLLVRAHRTLADDYDRSLKCPNDC